MLGESLAVVILLTCVGLVFSGSKIRDINISKILIPIVISTIGFLTVFSLSVIFSNDLLKAAPRTCISLYCENTRQQANNLSLYKWFTLGIFLSIIYSYISLPSAYEPAGKERYKRSIGFGAITLFLGIFCYFLDGNYPNAFIYGAFAPLATAATSVGATLATAAAIENEKINPDEGHFPTVISIYEKIKKLIS